MVGKEVRLKDGTPLVIREAREDDAEAMVAYMGEIGGESDFLTYGANDSRHTVEEEKQFLLKMKELPNSLFLAGFVRGGLACTANLLAEQKVRLAHNAEFGVSVRKQYWHLGAASALLAEILSFAKRNPVLKVIHLGVYDSNVRAVRLYEKFGFQKAGCHKDYFNVGGVFHDEILMDFIL